MWRWLYHDHYLLIAQKDTITRRRWLKASNFPSYLRRFFAIFTLLSVLLLFSIPTSPLRDQSSDSSEPTYSELLTIFEEGDTELLTVDDAAWYALLGLMKKWTDFINYHAYDPTKHPWLSRIRTLGKLLAIKTLTESDLIFDEEELEELYAWEEVSEILYTLVWDTLEQLILIGMEAEKREILLLPAGDGYFIKVLKQGSNPNQETYEESIVEPPGWKLEPPTTVGGRPVVFRPPNVERGYGSGGGLGAIGTIVVGAGVLADGLRAVIRYRKRIEKYLDPER